MTWIMVKYYIDTNIFRDYYENRVDKYKPLGFFANKLLQKIIKDNSKVIISDVVEAELKVPYSEEEIENILAPLKEENLLENVGISENQTKEAAELAKEKNVPFADAAHAILARDNNAILVTRDRDFNKLRGIKDYKKPEDLA